MNPIETLKYHNKWRRNGEGEMCNPAELGVAIDTVIADYEVMQKQNDELMANHLKTYEMNIKLCSLVASMHLRIDDEKASEIVRDESVKIIGEFRADQLAPAQSLADIKAEAVIEAADKVIRHNEHSFCIHCSLVDHANRIKEG